MSQDNKPNLDLINNLVHAAKTLPALRQSFKPLEEFLRSVEKNEVDKDTSIEYIQRAFALYGKTFIREINFAGKEIAHAITKDEAFTTAVEEYYFLLTHRNIPQNLRADIMQQAIHSPEHLGNYIVTKGNASPNSKPFIYHIRACAYYKAWRILVRMNNRYMISERELRITAVTHFINAANRQTGLKLDGNTTETTTELLTEGVKTLLDSEIIFISHGWGNQYHFARLLHHLRSKTPVDMRDMYIERLINILFKYRTDAVKPEVVTAQLYQYLVIFKLCETVSFDTVSETFKRFNSKQDKLPLKDFFNDARAVIIEMIDSANKTKKQ